MWVSPVVRAIAAAFICAGLSTNGHRVQAPPQSHARWAGPSKSRARFLASLTGRAFGFQTVPQGPRLSGFARTVSSCSGGPRTLPLVVMAKKPDGYYRRPSAAIEQGGQFFVPGAKDTVLRGGAAVAFILGLILNRVLSPGEPVFSQIISEVLGTLGCLVLGSQAVIQDRIERETKDAELRAAITSRVKEESYFAVDIPAITSDRARWVASALQKVTCARAVTWVNADGAVLARCGRFPDQSGSDSLNAIDTKRLLGLFGESEPQPFEIARFEDDSGGGTPPLPFPRNTKSALLIRCGQSGGILAIASEQLGAFTKQHERLLRQSARLLTLDDPKVAAMPDMATPAMSDMAQALSVDTSEPVTSLGLQLAQPEAGIALGSALLSFLAFNRLFTEDLLNSQSRSDLIGVLAPTFILVKALSDFEITPREADYVQPIGARSSWTDPSLPAEALAELEWAADSLFASSNRTSSVALWRDGRTLMLHGMVSPAAASAPSSAVAPGPLLSKISKRLNGAPDYLPALQLLPGRVEFAYFPENTQGILMLPLVGAVRGALIVGCNQQRGFGKDDITWARAVAVRLADALAEC